MAEFSLVLILIAFVGGCIWGVAAFGVRRTAGTVALIAVAMLLLILVVGAIIASLS